MLHREGRVKSDLDKRIEGIVAGVADRIAFHLTAPLRELMDEIVDERVRSRLAELLDGLAPKSAKGGGHMPNRTPRVKKAPIARGSAKATAGVTKCGKCKRTGHNARTCPKGAASDDQDEDESERPARTKIIAALIEKSSIGRGLKNARENGIEAELEDLDRELHPRAHRPPPPVRPVKAGPDGKLKALDTTTVAIRAGSPCPHGNGTASSCSQCVLAGAKVTRVAIVGGQVVVDGKAVQSTKEHEQAARPAQATRGAKIQRARAARQAA
jgi:hypothetical protein